MTGPITSEEIKEAIRTFLAERLVKKKVPDDLDIFRAGLVSSLAAMQLVMFVERDFEITVEDDDLDLQNFSTVRALAEFVEQKRAMVETLE